jgi:DNA modification methylase
VIITGDCLEVMATLDAESIDSIVTDPPYGLSFMGKNWDHGVPGMPFWSEALRVAKPGAHLLAFGGTRTFHRLTCAIEDAGWEIRDCVMWVYGSGFPKSHDVSKAIDKAAGAEREAIRINPNSRPNMVGVQASVLSPRVDSPITAPATPLAQQWQGWGTALKPAWEPIIVARKPLVGTVAANVAKYGCGGVNVDGCRIPGLTGQRLSGIMNAWEPEKNLCDSCVRLAKSHAKHITPGTKECSAESLAGLITSEKAGISQESISKAATGCFAGQFQAEPDRSRIDDGNLSIEESGKIQTVQFQKVTKSTTSTATSSTIESKTCSACECSITGLGINASMQASKSGTQNTQSVQGNAGRWPSNLIHDGSDEVTGLMGDAARFFYCAKASKADRDEDNHHPTVKPTDLMRYLCRLVTPPGGTVLDPFCGSGSTGKAATLEGFNFIGIEREAEYVAIAERRIEHASGMMPLLEGVS